MYFSTGNHEEFTSPSHYIEAIKRVGIRVLANEQVVVDGLRIAGVFYHDSSSPLHMKAALSGMRPKGLESEHTQPGILLNHAPTRLPIVEQAGFSLQVSGHTHGGQFVPYTWITRRIYGRFTAACIVSVRFRYTLQRAREPGVLRCAWALSRRSYCSNSSSDSYPFGEPFCKHGEPDLIHEYSAQGQSTIRTSLHGLDLLMNPRLNKGTAFTEAERDAFDLQACCLLTSEPSKASASAASACSTAAHRV